MQQYSTFLLVVVTAACFFSLGARAEWRPEKLKQCNLLHPSIIESLKNDTSVWGAAGITEDVVRSLHDPCKNEASAHACIKSQRILIKNGTVYVTNLMPVNGFGYVELIGFLVELYEASQIYDLPDAEFAYWHDDNPPAETVLKEDGSCSWPYAPKKLPPIMAWAKFKGNGVMLVPYSGAFRCPSDSFDALAGQLQAMAETPWEKRKPVGFGRWNAFCAWYYHGHLKFEDGRPLPCPREHVHHLSGNHSDILSARAMDKGLQHDKPLPLHEQHKFKYLVSTDGWSISSKFDKYLLMGSLIFKATGYTYGWYYAAMRAWEHYVPYMVKHENDLLDGLDWAKTHDAEAKKIAEAAQTFAMRNLNRQARLCYMFQLITELSKNFKYEVSCDRREVCVPLVEEIKFLSNFDRTHRHCKYNEVLAPYASDDPAAHPGDSYYEELLAKHKAVPEHKWGGRRRRARGQR